MLSISIVTYKSDLDLLQRLLCSLDKAISNLPSQYITDQILIIDNSNIDLKSTVEELRNKGIKLQIQLYKSPKNIGYGAAHNIAIKRSNSKYHLILNPDLLLAEDNLNVALHYMEENPDVVAISPHGVNEIGKNIYLTKNYPSLMDLFLRILPSYLTRKLFSHVMGIYENKYIVNNDVIKDVSLISGCYMLCRRDILVKVGLFNEKYFLYFEDFSLSIELNKFGKLIYHPCVYIVHFGGYTFSKGARHIFYFIRSAIRFFNKYGWKIF